MTREREREMLIRELLMVARDFKDYHIESKALYEKRVIEFMISMVKHTKEDPDVIEYFKELDDDIDTYYKSLLDEAIGRFLKRLRKPEVEYKDGRVKVIGAKAPIPRSVTIVNPQITMEQPHIEKIADQMVLSNEGEIKHG